MAKIIVAYPSCGKTFLANSNPRFLDLDSKVITEKYEGWEKDYIDQVLESANSGEYDYVLVSLNHEVLRLLVARQVDFSVVVPATDQTTKEMIVGRMLLRPDGFNYIRWIKRQVARYEEVCDFSKIKEIVGDRTIWLISPTHPYLSEFIKEKYPSE